MIGGGLVSQGWPASHGGAAAKVVWHYKVNKEKVDKTK
jgi:hypothetical protein